MVENYVLHAFANILSANLSSFAVIILTIALHAIIIFSKKTNKSKQYRIEWTVTEI